MIWDFNERKSIGVMEGHTTCIRCVAVTFDYKYIISGSNDKTVRIWDFFEKKQVLMLSFDDLITLLDIDANNVLEIYFFSGETKIVNLNELVQF